MPDNQWIDNMKRIMLQAVEAVIPVTFFPARWCRSPQPLCRIMQKTTVKGGQVLVPQRLTDHTETMVIPELGEVSVMVKSGLKPGEQVLLLQKKGGQQYLVLDRW